MLDAERAGSKTRYLNTAKQDAKDPALQSANVFPRVMVVGGLHRVGFYAARTISRGQELLLDCAWLYTVICRPHASSVQTARSTTRRSSRTIRALHRAM
jgi:hypothetical protein